MGEQKPKKPFLKRGTRQFLSNATVRSLNQKPRIVDFTEQDDGQSFGSPFINPNIPSIKNNKKQEIAINVKPKNVSRQKHQPSSANIKANTKRSSFENTKKVSEQKSFEQNNKIPQKTGQNNSAAKYTKKPTLLTDYLGNNNKVVEKKPFLNPVQKNSGHTFAVQSQAQHLKMQDLDDDSDDQKNNKFNYNQEDDNEFLGKQPKKQTFNTENINRVKSSRNQVINNQVTFGKKKPNLLEEVNSRKQKQKINFQPHQNASEKEVQFQSDSSDDQKQSKNHFKNKKPQKSYGNKLKQERNDSDQQAEAYSSQIQRKATVKIASKPHSKLTQMFNKNASKQEVIDQPVELSVANPKKLTITDVPQELVGQIVQKYFKQAKLKYQKKQQNLIEQVKIVQRKQDSLNEQQRTIDKKLKQFEKLMEQKNKEFQNKLKSEQNKISRQKMYLKDHQTSGKLDWKTKNQIQQLKQQLQDQRNQNKRIQVKLKGQFDRLKTRFNEQMENKKILQNRIREYELNDIKQKEIKYKQEKQVKMQTIQKKKTFWDNAPKQSYLSQFYKNDFSIIEYSQEKYLYEQNQFYRYYKQKGQSDILQAQEVEGNKIKRTYENGKIEIQSIQKFVKEVFPWGYTIVHYLNGDIKQVIQLPNSQDQNNPKRMEIYYAQATQIIQFIISDSKTIHYFLSADQIQLNDQLRELKQVLKGDKLQRIKQNSSIHFQRNSMGKYVQIY